MLVTSYHNEVCDAPEIHSLERHVILPGMAGFNGRVFHRAQEQSMACHRSTFDRDQELAWPFPMGVSGQSEQTVTSMASLTGVSSTATSSWHGQFQ